ncbi:hypothetical protein AVEN_190812-1 [Araneus ventricosus]|uniref:Uncharacterized protein n=1 Tax=Araneus ventricosus TaxID=182803 RepID=A0A4Y2DZ65_ARAVE|nr:hypothetical protein AVEN_190812-1 [Araneus ventricosus]
MRRLVQVGGGEVVLVQEQVQVQVEEVVQVQEQVQAQALGSAQEQEQVPGGQGGMSQSGGFGVGEEGSKGKKGRRTEVQVTGAEFSGGGEVFCAGAGSVWRGGMFRCRSRFSTKSSPGSDCDKGGKREEDSGEVGSSLSQEQVQMEMESVRQGKVQSESGNGSHSAQDRFSGGGEWFWCRIQSSLEGQLKRSSG